MTTSSQLLCSISAGALAGVSPTSGCFLGFFCPPPPPPVYDRCGLSSDEPFRTFLDSVSTDAPVLYPRNDEDLRRIIATARQHNCKVRPVGAGYSENGVVIQETDTDVVVVSLKNYEVNDPAWDGVINATTPSVRMSAADTNLKMMSVIRPQGYITISQTAGRIFNLAGLYLSPSTHGSGPTPRITEQLLAVRVMDADGRITVYDSQGAIKAFRGSSGLLGIVTGLEIKIAHYPWALDMTIDKLDTSSFDLDATKAWIRSKFEPEEGSVAGNHTLLNFFTWTDAIVAQTCRAPTDPAVRRPHDRDAAVAWYERTLRESPYEQQARAYPIANHPFVEMIPGSHAVQAAVPLLQGLGVWKDRFLSEFFEKTFMIPTTTDAWADANRAPNDGLFLENIPGLTPPFGQVDVIAKCWRSPTDCVDDAAEWAKITRNQLNKYKAAPKPWWCEIPSFLFNYECPWYPVGLSMMRRFTVSQGEMVLEQFSPGMYLGMELVTVVERGPNMKYSRYFAEMEEAWREAFPINGIHVGKAYAYDRVDRSKATKLPSQVHDELPFQDENLLQNLFSDRVRDNFIRRMKRFDPSETFKAGSLLHLLGLTADRYARPASVQPSCQGYGQGVCPAGQCCMGDGCSEDGGRTCYAPQFP